MTHVLQSAAWAAFQRSEGVNGLTAAGNDWSVSGLVETGPMRTRRVYAPYGPSFASAEGLDAGLEALESQSRSRGAVFVRVEPVGVDEQAESDAKQVLTRRGYHRVHHVQPEDTWRLDLSVGHDAILKGIRGGQRRAYQSAERHGVVVRASTDPHDVRLLTDLMGQVSERKDIHLRDAEYIADQAAALMPSGTAKLYLATVDGAIAAASLAYDHGDTRYYAHAGADYQYRKQAANVVLLVQMILDAQADGKKWFDFYGIAPDDAPADHPWQGFTKFKKSFGGQARHYLGTWEKPVRPLHYWIYETGRKLIAHK
ncbi:MULTISPECIES: lipid II:glycine glycyltransferase FemX [unclassified Pseudoclavibacter]|uniref:lipid II:glycine glycyltransferase FemX n=1 Tax=unclassified Pseudoclavibacter TaxID=2615177 RepID=UPI0013013A10|nr:MULTISPECIES: peptidoglycan bridge formation glycyltransferase FemA/FemB family protein [unclassified Pseudoclavibacter]KAB1644526.1 aminoacyltransferase [Pseudoclavibacter sp. CFCC 14310]KAB1663972.1 aminoacyltransferase [Pseudoclavibacter sp. CFCC 13611]